MAVSDKNAEPVAELEGDYDDEEIKEILGIDNVMGTCSG
jgi:hypothetical protein